VEADLEGRAIAASDYRAVQLPAFSAGEKSALLDKMLGTNPASRALLMPEQVNSAEIQAVERRLGWL